MLTHLNILFVEDNPGDLSLMRRAFKDHNVTLDHAKTGAAAIEFLETKVPHLLLMDLNLPGKSGSETLLTIRDNPHLKNLPTIIVTSSIDQGDIEQAWESHPTAYLQKPSNLNEYAAFADFVFEFWRRNKYPDNIGNG